ncbi:MAG: hypothetical protein IT539_09060 [Bradyrhizobiaceae bacterium]|nr:hypothetical protein [Bradyrhizobiaceae bacterium]
MARASKKRGRKKAAKSAKRKPKAKKSAKKTRRAAAKRKGAKRRPARRKPAKRAPKLAPARRDEPWPMVLAVVVALLVGLVAVWQFGGVTMAANAATYLPLAAADAAGILPIGDCGHGSAAAADTWLMVAHPGLVPVLR